MNNTLKGMTMAGLAAVFWGSMGVAGSVSNFVSALNS